MKTRNLLVLLSIIFLGSNQLFATDRVVQHNGPVGTYANISAAIAAATDGDNIVINNRQDALPWTENLTINKTLTLVSAVDNVQWWMDGAITIATAEGRNITIVGMRNLNGNITKTGANPVNRTVVNMMYCDMGGSITLISGINFHLGSSKVGYVYFSYGKVIGNDLRSLECSTDATATEDVNMIIGNRIGVWASPLNIACNLSSTSQYVLLSNNYIKGTSNGLDVTAVKIGTVGNRITNNSVTSESNSYSNFGARFIQSTGETFVENNMFVYNYYDQWNGSNGIVVGAQAAPVTTFLYNIHSNFNSSGTSLNAAQGNFWVSSAEFNNLNAYGAFITGTGHVNAGSPANSALDLDLTRNDIGVYGGSYSLSNFLPLMNNTESSRVNFMITPRVVNQGSTVNVQAIGFDK